ncbi:MAG: AMP-binding protein [Alphaproteobacteria bacterium]|nr:AMP-binding protein [Alphaproteobacteria bacterium]MBU1512499.1 AMP-binding protein [Alphaproteobacteria bacterium]MBU2096577.1 AMP-binding protein [Alphaproteobacteria bacterium]MBU2151605.1 AMP-binding protein [Alphaproteobacteria bacterium]MBU2307323.1 AMP-binding protein [Alphaproteobacteria bacterium]
MSPRPMGGLLDLQAARDPDRAALTCDGVTLSRATLAARANRRARALAAAGVIEGDFVAIALPNSLAFMEIAFACWILGATPAPVSHRLPVLELKAILELMQPRLVVGGESSRATGLSIVDEASLYDPALSGAPLPEHTARHVKAIPSGGSTGRPKVIVDHAPSMLDPDVTALGMRAGDVVVIPGPLYHAAPFGLTYMALSWGCHVVIAPRFDAAGTLELVQRYRGQWLYQVPTMMHRIWRLPDSERLAFDLSSLEVVCHIASACPIWLKEKWIDWLGPDRVWEVYSGTEALASTTIGGREWLTHKGSVGRLSPGSDIRILGEDGQPVAPGEIGEIYFLPAGGKGATYHYLGAEPRERGDWETFGDLGRIDEDGYLYLADRRTDLVISGGANIYPAEIEAALDAFPGVLASVAIGLPHEDLGQAVHAIVEVPAGPEPDIATLKTFLAERLVPYKLPRSFEFTTERLRDDAGKTRRGALRDARIA